MESKHVLYSVACTRSQKSRIYLQNEPLHRIVNSTQPVSQFFMASDPTASGHPVSDTPSEHEEAAPPSPSSSSSGLAELEKVRNILFGEQVRAHEDRLARLEERLMVEIRSVRSRLETRIEKLEVSFGQKLRTLEARLDNERATRKGDVELLRTDLGEQKAALLDEIHQVNDTLREALNATAVSLTEELHEKTSSLGRNLNASVGTLQESKVNRAQLADMLSEIVKGLNADTD